MSQIVVVGAGLAGLTCARSLQAAGYPVVVLEKSRGLGGRLATRRVQGTWLDHGTNYLEDQGEATRSLIATLQAQSVLQTWDGIIGQLTVNQQVELPPADHASPSRRYYAAGGITAIAKALASDLEIKRQRRVIRLARQSDGWSVTAETGTPGEIQTFTAAAVVLAIPAPQASALIADSSDHRAAVISPAAIAALDAVQFDPCFSIMAGYETVPLPQAEAAFHGAIALRGDDHPTVGWISQAHTKAAAAAYPTILLHTSATFAADWFEQTDVTLSGKTALSAAAIALGDWLTAPDWLQVHRWRYARVKQAYASPYLTVTSPPHPLLACGDWCGGTQVEAALQSGEIAAQAMMDMI